MIRGERVNLRAVERVDAGLLYRWLNDPAVMAYWGAPDHTVSAAEVQRRIEGYLAEEERLGRPVCFIVETLAGEAIGQVVFSRYRANAGSVELSIMIGESGWWGQGYGTDALQAAVDACFDAWNLHRIWLRSEASNERAHRLYARCGFVREAVMRQAAYVDGEYEDVVVFGLLRGELRRGGQEADGLAIVAGRPAEDRSPQPRQPARRRLTPPPAQAGTPRARTDADDAADRPDPPDASEPGPIHIPTDWLKPRE